MNQETTETVTEDSSDDLSRYYIELNLPEGTELILRDEARIIITHSHE